MRCVYSWQKKAMDIQRQQGAASAIPIESAGADDKGTHVKKYAWQVLYLEARQNSVSN